MSADPTVRAAAAKRSFSDQIAADLANPDPGVQTAAVDVLKKLLSQDLRDPSGRPIIPVKSDWCGKVLNEEGMLGALVKLGQENLITQLAAEAIADGSDLNAGDRGQAALVKFYLMTGKQDEALRAAKTYYNYCTLDHTAISIQLFVQALANGAAGRDQLLLDRFISQQMLAAQISGPNEVSKPQSSDTAGNVLKSTNIDSTPYRAKLAELAAEPQSFDTLAARGNLLLLSDKGAEAKDVFEKALDLAVDQKQIAAGVANVARALRARDGNVAAANAYLLSLRSQGSAV